MKNSYLQDDWVGQIFNQDDLFWGLDSKLEPVFEVGEGNILYISGWCFHKVFPTKKIKLILNQRSYDVSHINIIRSDIIKAFLDNGWAGRNCVKCGFWCAIPIENISENKDVRIVLEITFDNGNKKQVFLGEIIISPNNILDRDIIETRKLANKMVSEIKKLKFGSHVVICLASFNPNENLFQNQIDSIRNQTYQNWSCIINDDCSELSSYEWMRGFVGKDNRFLIARNEKNLGFYKNFERLLNFVPENADFVALSDQDDFWFNDKIERLVEEFEESTTLVYSDMKIVDEDGEIISNTFWTTRKNYYKELDYLILVNTITGAASMFRSSIIKYLLPFPISVGISYHDHWIGCVASALGNIKYIDEPLYNYYQHRGNVIGHATFSRRTLCDRVRSFKNTLKLKNLKESLVFYQCVFNIDGIRSIILASNLILRIPNINNKKKKELNTFYDLSESSRELFLMVIKTILNGKTTCDAERHLFKSYWADKIIRQGLLKGIIDCF